METKCSTEVVLFPIKNHTFFVWCCCFMWFMLLIEEIGARRSLMIRKSLILSAVILILLLPGCPEVNDTSFSYDPDPGTVTSLPDPSENLYIVANIDGKIAGFYSSDPQNYTIFTEDASTEENYSDIRISPDLHHILYAKINGTQKDLVLFNVQTSEKTIVAADIESNESEFIDNDDIQYSTGGRIRRFHIPTGVETLLVTNTALNCNHGGQISPDGNRIIFKDQDPNPDPNNYATIAWADNIPTDSCDSIISYSGEIELAEPFYFNWRDNNRVIFKPNPGLAYRLTEKTMGVNMFQPAVLSSSGENIYFKKIVISPDKENLLIYGHNGLYMLNLLATTEITGTIEPEEIYNSSLFITKYAAFGSESKSFVVGTSNWMGIYNTEGLQKTNASISNILGDYGTLYALHCR